MKSCPFSIEMKHIVKKFGDTLANDHIDLQVRPSEVHVLLGENGAGKTTLMNILYGLQRPDEGEIYVRGQRVIINSPKDAIELKIGMVHQEFMLIPSFTTAANVVLGSPPNGNFLINWNKIEERVADFSTECGLKIDPKARISTLPIGLQQRVEIVKALYKGVSVLILDEPTSALTSQEAEDLFASLKNMVSKGYSIILITHKLKEAMMVADMITVLRDGKVVSTVEKSATTEAELLKMMFLENVRCQLPGDLSKKGKIILKVNELRSINDKGSLCLKDISIDIHQGEILGIIGVAGNGQKELAETIAGLRKITYGKVFIDGQEITNCSPKKIIQQGLAYIPEDRINRGLIMDLTVGENLILKNYHTFSHRTILNQRDIDAYVTGLIKQNDVRTSGKDAPVRLLSGGNKQKLIFARELSIICKVLIAEEPTRGLDVKATEQCRCRLLESKKDGVGILLISNDLDEVLAISDRIAVIYAGEIVGIMDKDEANTEKIGSLMTGCMEDHSGHISSGRKIV